MSRSFTLTSEPKNIVNNFDFIGLLLGLPRLHGEKNVDYRRRLWDVYVHRASSCETGLVNGITRELGLCQYDAFTIDYTTPEYTPTSYTPAFFGRRTQIELYSNYNLIDSSVDANVLDIPIIDIYSRDSSSYYLEGLITAINTSAGFTATICNNANEKAPSQSIISIDSGQWQEDEELQPVYKHLFQHKNIIPGSVTFSTNVFVEHVDSASLVLASGDYHIDYINGVLNTYDIIPLHTTCRYMYNSFPLTVRYSPVILHEFNSSYFCAKVFEQILQPDGTYIDGLPTSDVVQYINELLNVKGMLWGD